MQRLDQLLVDQGLVTTRSRAAELVSNGMVSVNGKVIDKCGKKFEADCEIRLLEEEMPWVSRGSLKLIAALDHWEIDPKGKVAIDVGASTGGFSQVLLERNASRVYAIDTGKDQLSPKLLNHDRLINLEQQNFRYYVEGSLPEKANLAVMDVSFISQTLLYPSLILSLHPGAEIISLVKPQFEAGVERMGKGGIIRDDRTRKQILQEVVEKAKEAGFKVNGTMNSPIEGGHGNKEFLLYMTR